MKGNLPSTSIKPEGNLAQVPFVRVYSGGAFVRNFKIEPGTWTVGRDAGVDFVLDGRLISRKHFQFEYEGENRLRIQDLQSSNGTYVNGKKVVRSPLTHGDEIRVGEFELRISHPAFAQAQVIPFPKIHTDPQIVLPVEEPRRAPPVRPPIHPPIKPPVKPRVARPRLGRIGSVFRIFIIVAGAGGLAYQFQKYWTKRQEEERTNVRVEKPVGPTREVADSAKLKKGNSQKSPSEVVQSPKKEKESSVAPEPQATVQKTDLSDLRKSLGEIEVGDLSGIDQKVKRNDSRSESNLTALKKVQGSRSALDIDIELPSAEEVLRSREKQKNQTRFNPETYSAMLRERITGVQACYVRHIRSGDAGKISVSFSISKEGLVRNAAIDSTTFRSAGLEKCVLESVNKLKFDEPPWDGFSVKYGFRFGVRQLKF